MCPWQPTPAHHWHANQASKALGAGQGMLAMVPEEAGRQLCLQCLERDSDAAWASAWLGATLCRNGQYEAAIPRLQVSAPSLSYLCSFGIGHPLWGGMMQWAWDAQLRTCLQGTIGPWWLEAGWIMLGLQRV